MTTPRSPHTEIDPPRGSGLAWERPGAAAREDIAWIRGFAIASLAAATLAFSACGVLPNAGDGAAARETRLSPWTFSTALSRSAQATVGIYGVGRKDQVDSEMLPRRAADAAHRTPLPDQLHDPEATPAATIGAGFIVSADGLIATAAHVVMDADYVIVKLFDQQVLRAELVGFDEDSDIALLRVALPMPIAPPLGRSIALRAGDWVLAVGEPYGLDRSVVAGIVGGTDRHVPEDRDILFIQTDLALNPGNSGGPLLDTSGAIVGMNSRIVVGGFGTAGLALTIPIEIVLQIVGELQGSAAVERPRLGAHFEDVSPTAALAAGRRFASGAMVKAVSPQSLAEALDLRVGDVVVGMNYQPVDGGADLARALLAWRTVTGTTLTVLRDGKYLQLVLRERRDGEP